MTTQSIAIDVMGGDVGPKVTIPASLDALKKYPNLHIILVGDQIQIENQLKKYDEINHPRISIFKTTEVVLMDESPQSALKNKKN